MSKRRKKTPSVSALNQVLRQPDLSILGDSIKSLPPAQWKERMFFMGVPDTDLRMQTGGKFPATLRQHIDTHPVFVLRSRPSGHLLCPCTSRGNRRNSWYIAKGCRLEMRDYVMDRDSFLVESHVFTLPLDSRFSRKLSFKGVVPENCIKGGRK
ncbi:MAG: hypothetical protein U9P36_01640 [Thermodesulfobacteriota bacterium]|nr:hypothetical protein [Thermodesulfobacteriota bacterium]